MDRSQATRAAQFEKEDLLKNYRGLHAEKRRLEAGVDELQLARQRLTKVCKMKPCNVMGIMRAQF